MPLSAALLTFGTKVKRPACIILWTVAVIVIAVEWADWTLGYRGTLAQKIGEPILAGIFEGVADWMPFFIGSVVLALGVFGLLPGTRRPNS